jgi:ppGpp synthetase/RelA/SpoT-type nucleotidyltranferase
VEWISPEYSKSQVNRAGRFLVAPGPGWTSEEYFDWSYKYAEAQRIVNNWRASHNYPLNTFKVTLRKKTHDVDTGGLVAQRIKRMSSIELKLRRFNTMQMSQMQDLGGCRAIVGTTEQVRMLQTKYEKSELKHKLDDVDDYITKPKNSGYRGVHLIYQYNSDAEAASVYNGLFIEMQLRSKLQHAWATAVETVGTFLNQSLKSSTGEDKWLRFFALMGSAIARREGASNLVPNTPSSRRELTTEIRKFAAELKVQNTLTMYGNAVAVGTQGALQGHHFFLLKLEPSEGRMTVTGYPRRQLEKASADYLEVEKQIAKEPGAEAVLVSVDSLAVLQRAYPNYFLDTKVFLGEVEEAIKR